MLAEFVIKKVEHEKEQRKYSTLPGVYPYVWIEKLPTQNRSYYTFFNRKMALFRKRFHKKRPFKGFYRKNTYLLIYFCKLCVYKECFLRLRPP